MLVLEARERKLEQQEASAAERERREGAAAEAAQRELEAQREECARRAEEVERERARLGKIAGQARSHADRLDVRAGGRENRHRPNEPS